MDYKTLDWEIEAQRVMKAFGIVEPCEFKPEAVGVETDMVLRMIGTDLSPALPWGERLGVYYGTRDRLYQAYEDDRHTVSFIASIDWEGKLTAPFYVIENALFFAKGWLYLGLLTAEIEQALEVRITAHEKLEWALEYEVKHHSLDSEA